MERVAGSVLDWESVTEGESTSESVVTSILDMRRPSSSNSKVPVSPAPMESRVPVSSIGGIVVVVVVVVVVVDAVVVVVGGAAPPPGLPPPDVVVVVAMQAELWHVPVPSPAVYWVAPLQQYPPEQAQLYVQATPLESFETDKLKLGAVPL